MERVAMRSLRQMTKAVWKVARVPAGMGALVVCVLVLVAFLAPRFGPQELGVLGTLSASLSRRPLDPRIVVLTTDDVAGDCKTPVTATTFCQRGAIAEAVKRLALRGARVIILDLQFDRPICPEHDAALVKAIGNAKNVVVAAPVPDPYAQELTTPAGGLRDPFDALANAAWAVGSPVFHQVGGVVHSLQLVRTVPGDERQSDRDYPALSLAAFQRFKGLTKWEMPRFGPGPWLTTCDTRIPFLPDGRVLPFGGASRPGASLSPTSLGDGGEVIPVSSQWNVMLVNWAGPEGTVPSQSLNVVLKPSLSRRPLDVSGKVVLIGRTDTDRLEASAGPMPGLEMQANALNTLLSGSFVRPAPPVAMAGLLALLTVLTSLAVGRLHGIRETAAMLVLIAGVWLLSRALLAWQGIWLYPLSCVLGILLAWAIAATIERGLIPTFTRRVLDASILYGDLRGYTRATERLTLGETMGMVASYREAVEEIVTEHGGVIQKTDGDAILAFFWRKRRRRNHAVCAVQAAQAILRAFPGLTRAWPAAAQVEALGLGMSAGQVLVALIGHRRRQPALVGDPANLAERLEELTKSYGCPLIICERVWALLPDHGPEFVRLATVTVRGRETPVTIYGLRPVEGAALQVSPPQRRVG
jgi:class 3 adenylate cyclase/CHASE2 domain-containing sensor protein